MEISKKEKHIIAVENFFNNFKAHFQDIDYISISTAVPKRVKDLRKKDNIFPIVVYIVTKDSSNDSRSYSWEEGTSDDEYPIYDKSGEYYDYHSVKAYVQKNLPIAFKGKSFYQEDYDFNTGSISSLMEPIKIKLAALELDNTLKTNSNTPYKRIKL